MKMESASLQGRFVSKRGVRDWSRLIKLPIGVLNAAAALTGYVLFRPGIDAELITTVASVFLLACGAAALNNFQDRGLDGLFSRTRERPLPRRRISVGRAVAASMILTAAGLAGLAAISPNGAPPLLGLLAVILYNGLYTPLKTKTVLAVIPGAICGMLPPLIGWVAAGGSIGASPILGLMVVLGLWQLPHSWLILLSNQQEHRQAGMPNMLCLFSTRQLKRILFAWTLAFACAAMMLPAASVIVNIWLKLLLTACLASLVFVFGHALLRQCGSHAYPALFRYLNIAMGSVFLLTIADRMLPPG